MNFETIQTRAEDGTERTVLRLAGELTLPAASSLRDALLRILGEPNVVLEAGEVTETDLSGLQTLCSAHRSFLKRGHNVALENPSEALRATAQAAGYIGRSICPHRKDNHCLWIQ